MGTQLFSRWLAKVVVALGTMIALLSLGLVGCGGGSGGDGSNNGGGGDKVPDGPAAFVAIDPAAVIYRSASTLADINISVTNLTRAQAVTVKTYVGEFGPYTSVSPQYFGSTASLNFHINLLKPDGAALDTPYPLRVTYDNNGTTRDITTPTQTFRWQSP